MYTGQLEGFPIEVIERMVHNQVKQGNKVDTNLSDIHAWASCDSGGFDWSDTSEGWAFWNYVIFHRNFDLFFQKYPRQTETKTIVQVTFDPSSPLILLLAGLVENLSIDRQSTIVSDTEPIRNFQFETVHLPIVQRFLDRMKLDYVICQ